jgi:hypothetical protein
VSGWSRSWSCAAPAGSIRRYARAACSNAGWHAVGSAGFSSHSCAPVRRVFKLQHLLNSVSTLACKRFLQRHGRQSTCIFQLNASP